MSTTFAARIEIVLKALAISRGRLAADLGVDKSLVSRWLSGRNTPSGENLAQLTRLIAARHPGFTGLDWDRDPADLAALFGHDAGAAAAMAAPMLPGIADARVRNAQFGDAWLGHWWGYRQTFRDTDSYVRDLIRIRRRGDDLLFYWRHDTVAGEDVLIAGDGKAYAALGHRYAIVPAFFIFYSIDDRQMQVIDGLITTVTIGASREVVAGPYVAVRHADLAPNENADDALLTARAPEDWTIAAADLPPGVADRLTPRVSYDLLRISADASLARLSTPAEVAAAAAETVRLSAA